MAETPSVESAYVPLSLLWDLLYPFILRRVRKELECSFKRAQDSLLLLSIPKARRRLVAVRTRPWDALALAVHPKLMELLHWDALGTRIRIFSIFTSEAREEATRNLMPERLVSRKRFRQELARVLRARRNAVLSIPRARLVRTLAQWTRDEASFPLSHQDLLVLRMTGGPRPSKKC